MQTRKAAIPIILALFLALNSAPIVFASHTTPLKGSFTATFTETSPTTISLSGEGILSHLGNSDVSGTVVLTGPTTSTAFITITAADGDNLFITSPGTTTFTSTTTFTLSGTYTITGGTGHLADATGSGTTSGSFTFTGPTTVIGTVTLSGTITE